MEYTVGQVLSDEQVKELDLTTLQFCSGFVPPQLAADTHDMAPINPTVWARDLKAAAGYGIVTVEVMSLHPAKIETKISAIRDFRIGMGTIHRGESFGAMIGVNQAALA